MVPDPAGGSFFSSSDLNAHQTQHIASRLEGVEARRQTREVFSTRLQTCDLILDLVVAKIVIMIHAGPGGGKTSICQLLADRAGSANVPNRAPA